MTDYQAKKQAFLTLVPQNSKGPITNDFLAPIRDLGITDIRLICRNVCAEYLRTIQQIDERISGYLHPQYSGAGWATDAIHDLRKRRATKLELLDIVRNHREESLNFAEYLLWWESLSKQEKERIKKPNSEHYQQAWMATQEPTGKQLALLDSFGYQGTVDNRLHASQLIDEYITLRQDYKGRK